MASGLFTLKQVNQAINQNAWSGYIPPKWVEYLVVAGGGGAAINRGGGGGAGGLLAGIVNITPGISYTVTVGAGGAARITDGQGNNGVNSVFGSILAVGGGGGGNNTGSIGTAGGSGGGSGNSGTTYGGAGIEGQGNAGGGGTYAASNYGGGGGGGAGTVGGTGTGSLPGNGGAGISSAIRGSLSTYAGGGGGAGYAIPGAGGAGGGGFASAGANGGNGIENTGGGGGASTSGPCGAGGSGIVVVRYPGNVQFYTGGAISYANGHVVHTFLVSDTLTPTTPAIVSSDYQISRSLRFNNGDTAYLNRTPTIAGNLKTFTFSVWVKRTEIGNQYSGTPYAFIYSAGTSNVSETSIGFVNNKIEFSNFASGATNAQLRTTAVYRDFSSWYHIVVAWDTTQAIASNRMKIYVNGVQQTAFDISTYPAQNTDSAAINNTLANIIGTYNTTAFPVSAYMTEVNFVDGQALTSASFGQTDPNTGVWEPKAYTGTYGTNGFYLNFSDNSGTTSATLGKDYSGNNNNWIPNNFSVTAGIDNDSLVDVPTSYGVDYGIGGTVRGNYCTLNPLANDTPANTNTLSNGNLYSINNSGANDRISYGTMAFPTTGKWYYEVHLTTPNATYYFYTGLATAEGKVKSAYVYPRNGNIVFYDSSGVIGGNGIVNESNVANDIFSVAFNADTGLVEFYKNGVKYTQTSTSTTVPTGVAYIPFIAFGNQGNGCTVNFGQRPFNYTVPAGYKSLCTQNLPAPTIGSSPTTLANKYFNTVTYPGNGSTQSITGVGFQPDWTWIKARNTGSTNNSLYDAVRGAGKVLFSNASETQYTTNDLTSFNSDGFSVSTVGGTRVETNQNAYTYVAWNWKANGAGVTNTSGSVTSTVSANITSGLSIVKFQSPASGTDFTVGHGLENVPKMIIIKATDTAYAGFVWHIGLGNNTTDYLRLNATDAKTTTASMWGSVGRNSTVFGVSNGVSTNANVNQIAYCFAEAPGYSKFASYDGNASNDGPFVYCGFRPAYVMIKEATGGVSDWTIIDIMRSSYNAAQLTLSANTNGAEFNFASYGQLIDILSNGFKIRTSDVGVNRSGTFIFAAFAEHPFKYSLAR